MLLKAETVGLAVSVELPLLIVDVQRAGPSTGMPTKTEQADLLMALYGRDGESPVPVVAAATPSDCFFAAIEAARIAITYRTPVILLSDGYLANGSEPWKIPSLAELPDLRVEFATQPNGPDGEFLPYLRDPETLARPWAVPGTPGLQHRVGGIEKADKTGNISDVLKGGVADKSGVGPSMKIVAVNGRAYSPDVLKAAVHDAAGSGPAIELIIQNTGYFKTVRLDYHGGERYPQLEKVAGASDRLDDILKPRTH